MSWLSATRGEAVGMKPACTVGYYPGGVGKVADEKPSCPVLLHFGAADSHIGPEQSEAVHAAHPDVVIYTYEGADHAFANWARPSYKEDAAKLAHERSLAFLKANLA
jgi:carboxymethylenebutenolidase